MTFETAFLLLVVYSESTKVIQETFEDGTVKMILVNASEITIYTHTDHQLIPVMKEISG